MSNFEKWFQAQLGALPMGPNKKQHLIVQAAELRSQAEALEQRIAADDLISRQWTAALYAKQAAHSNFSF